MPTLRETIIKAIDRSGVSAYAIAQAAGMARQNLSAWINGRRTITVETVDRIIAAIEKETGARLRFIPRKKRTAKPKSVAQAVTPS